MIPVSDAYKAAIKSPSRTDRMTGSIILDNGVVINITDDIIVNNSVTLKEQIVSGDTIEIGTFNTNELNITIYDSGSISRSYANATIMPYYGILLPDGTWENVPLGVFKVDNSYTKRKGHQYILTAFDCSVNFDREISRHTARQTVKEHIISACQEVAVSMSDTFDIDDLPNVNELVTISSSSIQTYRDLIESCTALIGASAKIDRYGKFEIIKIDDKTTEENKYEYDKIISGDERFNIEFFDLRALIKYISTTIDGKSEVFTSTYKLEDEYGRNAVLNIPENPLLKDNGRATHLFEESIRLLQTVVLRKADFDFIGDPAIECFDTLGASGGLIDNGRTITVFPTKSVWKYRSKHTINCAHAELTEEKSNSQSGEGSPPTAVAVKDKTDKRIDGIQSDSGNGSSVFFAVGTSRVSIDTMPNQIFKVRFTASELCIPLFAATIPFVVTRAGTVKFNIVFDSTTINTYSQDCPVGVHFKTITMPLVGTGNGGHTVSVQILSADAAGTVDGANTYATVYGSGLEANAAWDGTIRVTQEIPHITLRSDNITLQDVSAKLTHRVWEPVRRGFEVSVGKLELTSDSITLETFDEAVDVVTEDIPHIVNTEKVKITLDPPQITLGGINDKVNTKQEE